VVAIAGGIASIVVGGGGIATARNYGQTQEFLFE